MTQQFVGSLLTSTREPFGKEPPSRAERLTGLHAQLFLRNWPSRRSIPPAVELTSAFVLAPLHARDDQDPPPGATPNAAPSLETAVPPKRKLLKCRSCGAVITHEESRIQINGSHEHMNVNPVAVVYRFGCFRDAEGADVGGEPITAHSWFPGFAWQFAKCSQCMTHLGWYFTGAETFFGIILERLMSTDD